MDYQLNLPLEMEPYRDVFLKSVVPFIKILPAETTGASIWQSKIGGVPYWPLEENFPKNTKGEPLFFLAQINFEEMPPLEGFPRQGLLQFFINDDGMFGLDEETPDEQRNFRVVFWENPLTDGELLLQNLPRDTYRNLPISANASYAMNFERRQEAVPLSDHNIHEYVSEKFFARFGAGQWDVISAYSNMVNSRGHKIGGYAFFTQEDIRYEMGEYELLFQLDTDQAIGCQWGDMGVAHFFIKKEDLEKGDFSKVLYSWDCY